MPRVQEREHRPPSLDGRCVDHTVKENVGWDIVVWPLWKIQPATEAQVESLNIFIVTIVFSISGFVGNMISSKV